MFDLSNQSARITLRPHYALKGSDLYFLASKRPVKCLTDSEKRLTELLIDSSDGVELSKIPVENLIDLNYFIASEWADMVQPLMPATAHHIVVVEPHMDDAILSVGGQMLLRNGQCRITILCVFGVSNYTSYMEIKRPYLDHEAITILRVSESRLAASLVGAEFQGLGLLDAPIRLLPPEQWSNDFLPEQVRMTHGFLGSHPIPHVVRDVAHVLKRALQDLAPDEIWIPMGLGTHVDHRTCRSACLQALSSAQGAQSQLPVRLYEDLPYSQQAHRQQILQAFKAVGTKLTLKTEDISRVMDKKLHAVGTFPSQFKFSFMAPRLILAASEVARRAGYSEAGEQFFELTRPFNIPRETALAINRDSLHASNLNAQEFARKALTHKHLNILVLPSGVLGSQHEVCTALAGIFPNMRVTINVIGENQKASSTHCFRNVRIKYVSATSWFSRWILARELLRMGTPMILVRWGDQQGSWLNRAVLKLLQASRTLLIAPSLSDLSALWEEALIDGPGLQ